MKAIVLIVIGLIMPLLLGDYPVSFTWVYFALLILSIALSMVAYKKYLPSLMLLMGCSVLGVAVYVKSVERSFVKIANELDGYKLEHKKYPQRLSEINQVAPSYYARSPIYYSSLNYFVFKFKGKGALSDSFGFTSSDRTLGSKKLGWEG